MAKLRAALVGDPYQCDPLPRRKKALQRAVEPGRIALMFGGLQWTTGKRRLT